MTARILAARTQISQTTLAVAAAFLAGGLMIFAAGFAQASAMHDSAHDQRHAIAFPCH